LIRFHYISDRERCERAKILLQYAMILFFFLIAGILLFRTVSDDFIVSQAVIMLDRDETVFLHCQSLYEYIRCMLKYAMWDIASAFALFICSFAVFNYVASDIILAANAVKIGFSLAFLSLFISVGFAGIHISLLRFIVFLTFRLLVVILLYSFAYACAIFSRKIRGADRNGRTRIRPRVILPFLLDFAASLCMILLCNFLYCIILACL